MKRLLILTLCLCAGISFGSQASDTVERILVTVDADYHARISVGPDGRVQYLPTDSEDIDTQYLAIADTLLQHYPELTLEDRWPISRLNIYCYVFALRPDVQPQDVIARLARDARIESAQPMNQFETTTGTSDLRGLQDPAAMKLISDLHRVTRGENISIAIIDSAPDLAHEDLEGLDYRYFDLTNRKRDANGEAHGTAITGLLAARNDNQFGIDGIAPAAHYLLLRGCWEEVTDQSASCNSFTLAKALSLAGDLKAKIVNLSLDGPHDPLLARLIESLANEGVIIFAAKRSAESFPGNLPDVIGISASVLSMSEHPDQRLTLLPANEYGFRSGVSIHTAEASGLAALLLAQHKPATLAEMRNLLHSMRNADNHSDAGDVFTKSWTKAYQGN